MSKPLHCHDCKRQVMSVLEHGETSAPHQEHAPGCAGLARKVVQLEAPSA